jgi:hypothetical protein
MELAAGVCRENVLSVAIVPIAPVGNSNDSDKLPQEVFPNPAANTWSSSTSTVRASRNPDPNPNPTVGIGPTISQFPANGLTAGATGPPPQPDKHNPIPQAVKLNKAKTFIG